MYVPNKNNNNNDNMRALFVIQFINQFILFFIFFSLSLATFAVDEDVYDDLERDDSFVIFESQCFINWFAWFLELFEFIISDIAPRNVIAMVLLYLRAGQSREQALTNDLRFQCLKFIYLFI